MKHTQPLGFGERVKRVWLEYSVRVNSRISQGEFGRLVAKTERPVRRKPYVPSAVAAWFDESGEPSLRAFIAMGKLSGQHPSVIAFGDAPGGAPEDEEDFARTWKRGNTVRSKP